MLAEHHLAEASLPELFAEHKTGLANILASDLLDARRRHRLAVVRRASRRHLCVGGMYFWLFCRARQRALAGRLVGWAALTGAGEKARGEKDIITPNIVKAAVWRRTPSKAHYYKMASGWCQPIPPKSGLQVKVNKREWNQLPPERTGDTPAPNQNQFFWAPKAGPPRFGPNPMRRLPARREPENWKEPKANLFEEKDKENAQRLGWGVSAPAARKGAAKPPAAPARKGLVEQQHEQMKERRERQRKLDEARAKQQPSQPQKQPKTHGRSKKPATKKRDGSNGKAEGGVVGGAASSVRAQSQGIQPTWEDPQLAQEQTTSPANDDGGQAHPGDGTPDCRSDHADGDGQPSPLEC